MSRVYIDTDKLEDDSKRIKEYVTKLDELLTKYVTRMLKVPNETKEWQGNSADAFMDIIKKDYQLEYSKVISEIRSFANELHLVADDYKSIVKDNVI
jgi:uncharacterized protein YukE